MPVLKALVANYSRNPIAARRQMANWASSDPRGFSSNAAQLLPDFEETPGFQYLTSLLLDGGHLLAIVCDGNILPKPKAVDVVRKMCHLILHLDVKLLRTLLAKGEDGLSPTEAQQAESLVAILNLASPGNRLLPTLVQLLRKPDARIRSNTAKAMGLRNNQTETLLNDPDPTVRANAVEAFWHVDSTRAKKLLREALRDSHNRVVGNGLLGLLWLGEESSVQATLAMSAHPLAAHRASAVWVMGQSGNKYWGDPLY